jgi:hypothetical protein
MAQLQKAPPHWCWIYCLNPYCERVSRPTAIAIAPYVIRWGANAPSDMLRRCARCVGCGHKGATLRVKQEDHARDDYAPFPIQPTPAPGSTVRRPFYVDYAESLQNK